MDTEQRELKTTYYKIAYSKSGKEPAKWECWNSYIHDEKDALKACEDARKSYVGKPFDFRVVRVLVYEEPV